MIKTPIRLQDLRKRIYVKAKAEKHWRFWGLFVHVCKMETLREAYRMAKKNKGAPGVDGVTFEAIEEDGLEEFLQKLRGELVDATYRPMRNLRAILKASGKRGVPQGGVISPLLANIYLNEVDRMLEKAREVTREGKYTRLQYARFADDLVVLIDGYPRWNWLVGAVKKRLLEELSALDVEVNTEKTHWVNLAAR